MTLSKFGLDFPSPVPRTAVTGVTVLPMDGLRKIENQTVIVERGIIRSIGPIDGVSTEGAHVMEGRGKFLLPGLADMHVHYWDPKDAAMFLANGVTTVRNMWGGPVHLMLEKEVSQSGFPGPHVITTSPIIDGLSPAGATIWDGCDFIVDPEEAAPLVEKFASRGYSQIKVYQQLTPQSLAALGKASAEAGLRMVGHCPDGMSHEDAIEAGMSCFEHLTGVGTGHIEGGLEPPKRWESRNPDKQLESLRLLGNHLDFDKIRKLADLLAERDIWNCPTVTVWQGSNRDPGEASNDERLKYLDAGTEARWMGQLQGTWSRMGDRIDDFKKLSMRRHEALLQVIGIFHQAGAPLLLGTDCPNPFVFPGFSIHDELDNLLAAGLSPYEAIRCGTAEAARFMGSSDWGVIGEGKRCDMVLLDSDPLEDVRALRTPAAVLVGEFVLERDSLNGLLDQKLKFKGDRREGIILPATRDDEEVLIEGVLKPLGQSDPVPFRHRRLSNGQFQIDEGFSWGSDEYVVNTLFLDDSMVMQRGEFTFESFMGPFLTIVTRDPHGYQARSIDPDGYEETSRLDFENLYATGAMTYWPELIATGNPPAELLAFDLDRGRVGTSQVTIAIERKESGEQMATVTLNRRGNLPVLFEYRIGADGKLLGLKNRWPFFTAEYTLD